MRITNNYLITSFLSQMSQVNNRISDLMRKTSTGAAFERPSDDPSGVASSMGLSNSLKFMAQYKRNMSDGTSYLSQIEEVTVNITTIMQRSRELAIQGGNDTFNYQDRQAMAKEIDQALEQISGLANTRQGDRFLFAGYKTLTPGFQINRRNESGQISSFLYKGNTGVINRNISDSELLASNLTGKELFLNQTSEIKGRPVNGLDELGYNGTFTINNQTFNVTPTMALEDIKNLINTNTAAEVQAVIDGKSTLRLISLDSSRRLVVEDLAGTVAENLGILPQGAFTTAIGTPTVLPAPGFTDSTPAQKTGLAVLAPAAFPLTIDSTNDTLVVGLSGAAYNNKSRSYAVKLQQRNYVDLQDIIDEVQFKLDQSFGTEWVKVQANATNDGINLQTYKTGANMLVSTLSAGGMSDSKEWDTASVALGLTVAGTVENADTAGIDGDDRFIIELKASCTSSGNDIAPQEIDLDASKINLPPPATNTGTGTVADLVAEINRQILKNPKLATEINAVESNGKVKFETIKKGYDAIGSDLLLTDATALSCLNAMGGFTSPGTKAARVLGTFAVGPVNIVQNVNDTFLIDLGPQAALDGVDRTPIRVTLQPGVYATVADIVKEMNRAINVVPELRGSITASFYTGVPAEVPPPPLNSLIISTTREGSRIQASELTLTEDGFKTGLANLGLLAPTITGSGGSNGQSEIKEPDNMVDFLIQLRDELSGVAGSKTSILDMLGEDQQPLCLLGADTNVINISSGGTTTTIKIADIVNDKASFRFTLEDLANAIQRKLGSGVDVYISNDGKFSVENKSSSVITDVKIEVLDAKGNPNNKFNEAFRGLIGDILPDEIRSTKVLYDSQRVRKLNDDRLAQAEFMLDYVINERSIIGSRVKRIELTDDQTDGFMLHVEKLKTDREGVDMAETITKLTEQQNVLRATLGAGGRVIQPSLFDFLR